MERTSEKIWSLIDAPKTVAFSLPFLVVLFILDYYRWDSWLLLGFPLITLFACLVYANFSSEVDKLRSEASQLRISFFGDNSTRYAVIFLVGYLLQMGVLILLAIESINRPQLLGDYPQRFLVSFGIVFCLPWMSVATMNFMTLRISYKSNTQPNNNSNENVVKPGLREASSSIQEKMQLNPQKEVTVFELSRESTIRKAGLVILVTVLILIFFIADQFLLARQNNFLPSLSIDLPGNPSSPYESERIPVIQISSLIIALLIFNPISIYYATNSLLKRLNGISNVLVDKINEEFPIKNNLEKQANELTIKHFFAK